MGDPPLNPQLTAHQSQLISPSHGAALRTFEVRGTDRGADLAGSTVNFGMGEAEIASGAAFRFVDAFDNDGQAQAPCCEALNVRRLVLQAASSITLVGYRVYHGQVVDQGGMVSALGCGEPRFVPTGDVDGRDFGRFDPSASLLASGNGAPMAARLLHGAR